VTRVALVALAAVCAACSEAPRAATPGFWTLLDAQQLYAGGATADQALATDAGLPGGLPLGSLLDPDGVTLSVHAGFAEGYDASYVTTEIWSHYDRVWLQPFYAPVTGWDENNRPVPLAPDGAAWIFGVGPQSGFYSPFWQMIYVDVPADTQVGQLTSVRQIIDGGYTLHPGPGRTVVFAPGTDVVAPTGPTVGSGWLDGAPAPFIDFGQGLASWDEAEVIEEVPLYVFAFRGAEGTTVAPDVVPGVMAPGPPRSGLTTPPVVNGQPRYSAYWRIYRVNLPPTARVFAPDGYGGIDATLAAAGAETVSSYPVTTGVAPYLGKVALDMIEANNAPGCFADANRLEPDSAQPCHWLDSQLAIETFVDPSLIEETDITVTAPVTTIRGTPVLPL
jgi:hypothetical protein